MRREWAAVALMPALLGACAQPEWFCVNPQGVRSMTVRSAADAVRTDAVAVALVSVTEPSLGAELAQLPAEEFFRRREQLRRDHAGGLDVVSFELAPDQSIGPVPVDTPCSPVASLIFASYRTPGEHRIRVDGAGAVTVVLSDRGFEVAAP